MEVMRTLDRAGVDATDLNRRSATLDDVFLSLTARPNQLGPNAHVEASA